ncbi:bzip transcription factor [Fusarium phyllophilum]|uniref:Bzip transcription factor n=1 Tax=Fusarium phyllophilum TaxID=47803 RepID=A0A8H5JPT8_9HYPO|nr:bzip transcription factor [Fusarium phyllophilum]
MTGGKKEGSTNPSAVRIRDNQRRSRARHKEYVEGLQKKLQDYERRGVEATLEMQQAARSVAVENSRLKILLGYHGITNEDVEKFLQSFPDQPASEAAKAAISQSTSGQPLLAAAPKIPLQPLSRGHSAEPPRSTLPPPHIAPEKTSTRDVVDAVVGIKRDARKAGLPSGPTLPLPVEQRQPLLQPRPQPPILPALPALVLGQGRPDPNPLDKLSVLATASVHQEPDKNKHHRTHSNADSLLHRGNTVEESGSEFVKRDTKKRKENGVFEGVELIERHHKRLTNFSTPAMSKEDAPG